MKFEIFKSGVYWYFRIKAGNGKIIAQSEGYMRKRSAVNAVGIIRYEGPMADVVEL